MRESETQGLGPLLLEPSIQRYAWGDPRFIPQLLGRAVDGGPWAEAWYGAHPVAPATVHHGGARLPLDELVRKIRKRIFGRQLEAEFGGLPYLLKLLAAARPLSIQVHPNRRQAEEGFAKEQAAGVPLDAAHRRYRDPNHKPEVLVALTEFDALCGFRQPDDIARVLASLPEVASVLPAFEPGADGLRRVLEAWFAVPRDEVTAALRSLLDRIRARDAESAYGPTDPEYWALQAHDVLTTTPTDPPDRGLLFVFLLAIVRLQPGQALFLPAGVPHAYLRGAGVELMASSDNVLRAGLTPKHVDPAELLAVVRFDAGPAPILEPIEDSSGVEATYPVAAAELDLRRLALNAGEVVTRCALGPETLLVLGDAAVEVDGDDGALTLEPGQACLVPHGQRYALRASGPATVFRVRVPGQDEAPSFRGARPTALTFGTSGLRGLVTDITDLEAYVNTRGFIDFLIASGDAVPGTPVALAGDRRPSTDGPQRSIMRAVARAVTDAGLQVVHCGRIPTPALTYFGLQRRWPSIMVTGSHIPFDRNGIKFNKSTGEVLKSDEAAITKAVARVRAREYERAPQGSPFRDDGSFRDAQQPSLPPSTDEARSLYLARYRDAFGPTALQGLRVALYEHSAVGRELVGEILEALGATVIRVGRTETFEAIDTEAITEAQLQQMQALANEATRGGERIDALVSTDGDSDRPLVMGIDQDGNVRFVPGDVLGALVADALAVDAIAIPVSSNDLVDRHFEPRGVPVKRTRIGSPWVIAAMDTLPGTRRVGWEANGGFLVGSTFSLRHGTLSPLPTRDAVLPIVATLQAARDASASLVDLVARLPQRFSQAGLLDDVDPAVSAALLRHFGPDAEGVRQVMFTAERVAVLGLDGAAQSVDVQRRERWLWLRDRLAEHFDPARGFAPIESVDYLDGVRITFADGDVAHVRPSGNAPQLRIYAVADTPARAQQIVSSALREPDGILRGLLAAAAEAAFADAIGRNIDAATELLRSGGPAAVVGTVCGSEAAQQFWQHKLDRARDDFAARTMLSLYEDLPVNQALGLLLLWKRLRPVLRPQEGALMAFVFGEGTRAAPLTEAECGQKAAIESFVAVGSGVQRRYLSTVELALRSFAPVESHLRRSGFDGIVVKWGDEVQIPVRDLAGTDPRLAGADVVRFVSMRTITADDARNKDWVGVDDKGNVTAFIPRRPMEQMEPLADRGLLQRRAKALRGGVNLGSIAASRALLDGLLEEFEAEVDDPSADRKHRPDLDPQFFTALTIARIDDPQARASAWQQAQSESPAVASMARGWPELLPRLRGVLERFERRHGRKVRVVAMDFGDQYWGDVGQHRQMYAVFMALRERGVSGAIARRLAGIATAPDDNGNIIVGDTVLGADVKCRGSVLIDAHVHRGEVADSVLIGTRCGMVLARDAFDVRSTATELSLAPRSGSYKVVSGQKVSAGPGERITAVFVADRDEGIMMRVHEDTDLRDRATSYDVPILGNELSFAQAHALVTRADPAELEAKRRRAADGVVRKIDGNAKP